MGKNSLDVLGIAPIANAIDTTVSKSFEGAEGLLKRVCAPALEELGLILGDKVRHWRLNNITKFIEKSKGKFIYEDDKLKIHPRVAIGIIDNASLNDNDEVQEMWAGLFVASFSSSEQDDGNLLFINLLKQLTISEARILKYSCEATKKIRYPNNLITGSEVIIKCEDLIKLTGVTDIHRLDRELDHLRYLGLIGNGFGGGGFRQSDKSLNAYISPTGLALNLFARSQGCRDDISIFWKDSLVTNKEVIV